ncbi:MAG: sulfotransferase [Anaerolineae bacterium]|nr:sulfotransferase [Anaerolineae bacterium]
MRRVRGQLFQAKKRLHDQWLLDLNTDSHNAIFIAGTARSGTTWLTNIINYRNEYRYIFEPFYPARVPAAQFLAGRQYVRPDEDNPDLLALSEHILSGQIRNTWTARYNKRIVSQKRIVKAIRANMFLKWLRGHYPTLPIVLLLRHPCAVANSWVVKGYPQQLSEFLAQPALMEDFLEPHRDVLSGATDPFEQALLVWCVETLVPLIQLDPGDIHLMFYEQLVREPEQEIKRLFEYLKLPYDPAIMDQVEVPSQTSHSESAVVTGSNRLAGWREHVSQEHHSCALELLKRFGLDTIYSDDPLPDTQAVWNLKR